MHSSQIIIKKTRGKIAVQAMGQTPRGQAYIKAATLLNVTSITDPKFKKEMAAAVAKLLDSGQ